MEEMGFPFPFPAYTIQKDFMSSLYQCINEGKLGIFESPTGTGKTMSIICGALKWLLDHESKSKEALETRLQELEEKLKEIEKESNGDWITDHSKQMLVNEEKRSIVEELAAIDRRTKRKANFKEISDKKLAQKKSKKTYQAKQNKTDLEENSEKTEKKEQDDLLLEEFVAKSDDSEDEEEISEDFKQTQFFLCSRTHSQLTQFIGELKKSPYSDKVSLVPMGSRQNYCINKSVKQLNHVDLINERCLELQRSKKTTVKKEKTLKKSKTSNTSCPFNPGDQQLLIADIVSNIHDIEEIVESAKDIETCPYYASRKSLEDGQVIVLPYNSILHKNTRTSSGINLKNSVIIIDEAHNLLEAIERMHSNSITGRNILHCYNQLTQYQKRFENLFSAKNVLYLNQLSFCLKKFMRILGGSIRSSTMDKVEMEPKVYSLPSFESTAEIDSVNVFELIKFIQSSKLAHKLQGYLDKHGDEVKVNVSAVSGAVGGKKTAGVSAFLSMIKENSEETEKTHNMADKTNKMAVKTNKMAEKTNKMAEKTNKMAEKTNKMVDKANKMADKTIKTAENSVKTTDKNDEKSESPDDLLKCPLLRIVSFLETLKNSSADGRIFIIPGPTLGQSTIKFLLMNPAAHFHDIVKEARSVILAGGTMEPISEFRDQLFILAGAPASRILTFSCDHVVPRENILTRIVGKGPSGVCFEFNYQNRDNKSLLDEVGRALVNLTKVVPGGIVVFLPSYKYEETLYKHFEVTGVISKIATKKKVFREPKSASLVNSVLEEYAEAIKSPKNQQNGSLLFSVVAGKLSEGLNFSDDLGRCIVVVGMPYPNVKSPELQEKIKYLNENVRSGAGNEYYENSCMKAVNQCIGRAVRHINDYATVILLDKRYSGKAKALPGWIQRTLLVSEQFGSAVGDVAKFFAKKK